VCARESDAKPSYDTLIFTDVSYTSAGWAYGRILPKWVGWAGAGGSVMQWNREMQLALAYVPLAFDAKMQKMRARHLMQAAERAVAAMK
jgi:hypothetical protein